MGFAISDEKNKPERRGEIMTSIRICFFAVVSGFAFSVNLAYGWGDNTSQSDPYVFWINNNYDRSVYSSDDSTNIDDDVAANTHAACCPYKPNTPTPDYDYRNSAGNRIIPCKRDLQDFARIWIEGVTPDLRAKMSTNYVITLNWGDVGSPNSANPTIDLFVAAQAGYGYLTNDGVAATQIDPSQCPYVGRIGPGQSIQINANNFGTNWFGDNFIFCGVSNGSGGFSMTIADNNGSTIATTTTYLKIVDIKQMYERWTVGDRPAFPPKAVPDCAVEDLPPLTPAFQYPPSSDSSTPYILFVHGWNMQRWEKDRFAESAFKRLYWMGYHGRFGEFRWPTGFGFSGIISVITDARNFDNSESNAWASATGLLYLLNQLNAQYPANVYLMAHSMGNVVAGEALRLAGTNQLVNTYVAMQGALSAHCYDSSTPNRITPSPPDRYAYYSTDGAPPYFNGIAGAGAFVNFYNVNDYALGKWNTDQNFKPDDGLSPGDAYHYSSSSGFYKITGVGTTNVVYLNFPGDTHEIFAYADPAWSYALGTEGSTAGLRDVDLQTVWPSDPLSGFNYSSHFWHSAEFRGDYPLQISFWRTVLGSDGFGLK